MFVNAINGYCEFVILNNVEWNENCDSILSNHFMRETHDLIRTMITMIHGNLRYRVHGLRQAFFNPLESHLYLQRSFWSFSVLSLPFVCLSTMSANKDNEGMTTNPLEGSAVQKCRICSEPISNTMFAPYCSLKCAKTGTSKRYELLRCFFDFEAKYINPRKKVDAAKSKKLAAKKERKKLKK